MLTGMTTRITVTVEDELAALIRSAARMDPKTRGNVSEWLARAARSRLLREAALGEIEWERAHPDRAQIRMEEVEAERDARWSEVSTEEAFRRRGLDAA